MSLGARGQAVPRVHRRVALASVATALLIAAVAVTGGLGYARAAVSRAASAVRHTTRASVHRQHSRSHRVHTTSGEHDEGTPICLRTHGATPYAFIHVSDETLPAFLTYRGDIVPAPMNGCPTG